ncbi:hypothetical protein Bealeia2_02036 (plasmid) [Candidatus Bealeia paramacronuclearis]|uniref:hypothetical protein n=1 Tax=Candidatus Bealeia paramacronuclearis TaxID=1921001 RepID=UPI002B68E730|nr:hypothetical protein [Candidatus Bealeia paramacronuclearis]
MSARKTSNSIIISPTADSGLSTQTQRIAEPGTAIGTIRTTAVASTPFIERICRTLGIGDIDEVLITPDSGSSLDPVSENMRALSVHLWVWPRGKTMSAHIQVHEAFWHKASSPVLMAHIAGHQAQLYRSKCR